MRSKVGDNFAVFILSYARPDRVWTFETLKRQGYTGAIHIIVADDDPAKEKYIEIYGSRVVLFNRKEIGKTFDVGDNFNTDRGVIYARNANFEIARSLGYKYFIQLDDDYRHFQYRFDDKLEYKPKVIRDLDSIFRALVNFLASSGATTMTIAQGGDFIGGPASALADKIKLRRKAMNSFVCSVDRPFSFPGRINEDVNAYVSLGSKGGLFFMTNQLTLEQTQTQSNSGGMTELYLESGTYLKSFYSVLFQPSSVKVALLQDRNGARLHHRVTWKNTVPKILRESVRKSASPRPEL